MLKVWREKLRDQLEDGLVFRGSEWETMAVRQQVLGNLDALRQLQDIDYNLLMGELTNA